MKACRDGLNGRHLYGGEVIRCEVRIDYPILNTESVQCGARLPDELDPVDQDQDAFSLRGHVGG